MSICVSLLGPRLFGGNCSLRNVLVFCLFEGRSNFLRRALHGAFRMGAAQMSHVGSKWHGKCDWDGEDSLKVVSLNPLRNEAYALLFMSAIPGTN